MAPSPPIVPNHTIITGPNSLPIVPVPRLWMKNSPNRIATVIGMTSGSSAGFASLRPSIADSTEIAGVIVPSP
jgi:hypothetical protein